MRFGGWHFAAARAVLLALLVPGGAPAQARPAGDNSTDVQAANEALHNLLASPLGQTLPRLQWRVELVESWRVNAYFDGRGRISITRGLASMLDGHPGVWAAAIAHEMGHAVMLYTGCQPQFEAALRRAFTTAGGDLSDPAAERALRVSPAAEGLLNLKGARRGELEADRLGVLLMAEAGYHPEFAVALDRLLRSALGDQARLSEFMLSHPLWSDREQATERIEGVALTLFNHAWPDAARSPGGEAPPLGKIESVTVSPGPEGRGVALDVKFELKNAGSRPARIAAVLLDRNRKVRASRAEYRAADGSLALNAPLDHLEQGQNEASLQIPCQAFQASRAKLVAAVFLAAGDWTDDVWFQPINLPCKR